MEVQWFPGHMAKAMREMKEDIGLIDLVIEVVDARIPLSSRNPELDRLAAGKSRLLIFNKTDLSDDRENERWLKYFSDSGIVTVRMNSKTGLGVKDVNRAVDAACAKKIERDRKRGIKERPVRAMVVGIPNVGKSAFINSFAGKSVAKAANKPGVTRGKQWVRLGKKLELMDTPGVMWPKFEGKDVGLHLAMTGAVNDMILPAEELALNIMDMMQELYPGRMDEKYGCGTLMGYECLEAVSLRLGCLKKGGEADTEKGAAALIKDFRAGNLGKITIERVG
ncbi:MAG: ribosome biogenesis GTPase YlqF [Lachnospiraceae bacterium]|nr:ribosome biogenesis GTPase YlqF [Lachnospiraceae bacterium]